MARRLPTGITEHVGGYRVFVWLNVKTQQWPKGRIASRRYPKDTPLDTMKAWREAQRVDNRRAPAAVKTTRAGFLARCETYLEAVAAMPTFSDRARQIREWIKIFGDAGQTEITPARIRAARDRWLTSGPKLFQVKDADGKQAWEARVHPLSASTVNGRLRALENLYTVLDGRQAYNPVREVPEADPPDEAPRAIPKDVVAAILAALPDRGSPEAGGHIPDESKTKARLSVMAYTGLSHSQLARVQPADLDLGAGTLYLRPRHKGQRSKTGKGQTVPLLPAAIEAFGHFVALGCWGKFSRSSMRKSFRRAVKALDLPDTLRVYDIRHGFGSQVYAATGDLHATGLLLGHRDFRTTTRYTMAAVDPRLKAAMEQLAAAGKGPVSFAPLKSTLRHASKKPGNAKNTNE